MSTNYYINLAPVRCQHCGHEKDPETYHVGLSAQGWVFQLHSIPEQGLTTIEAWGRALKDPENVVFDEYDVTVSGEELLAKIEDPPVYYRSWAERFPNGPAQEEAYHIWRNTQRGPRNLLRTKNSLWGSEEGPCYELHAGEFS